MELIEDAMQPGDSRPRMSRLAAWGAFGMPAAVIVVLVIYGLGTGLGAEGRSVSIVLNDMAFLFGGAIVLTGVCLSIAGLAANVRDPGRLGGKRLAILGIVLPLVSLLLIFSYSACPRWEGSPTWAIAAPFHVAGEKDPSRGHGWELVFELHEAPKDHPEMLEEARKIVARRLEEFQCEPAQVAAEAGRLVVRLPAMKEASLDMVKRLVMCQGSMEFRFVITDRDRKRDDDELYRREVELRKLHRPPSGKCHWYKGYLNTGDREWSLIEDGLQPDDNKRKLTEALLDPSGVHADVDDDFRPCIHFKLKPEGAELLGSLTEKNRSTSPEAGDGRRLAIIMNERRDESGNLKVGPDGQPYGTLYSDPIIQSKISDHGNLSGRFSDEEARFLAALLKGGRLPGRLELKEMRTPGSERK